MPIAQTIVKQVSPPIPWKVLTVFLCFQIQWPAFEIGGGFDSHILPPKSRPVGLPRSGGHFIFYLTIQMAMLQQRQVFAPPTWDGPPLAQDRSKELHFVRNRARGEETWSR